LTTVAPDKPSSVYGWQTSLSQKDLDDYAGYIADRIDEALDSLRDSVPSLSPDDAQVVIEVATGLVLGSFDDSDYLADCWTE
jgi:hypothetical protein